MAEGNVNEVLSSVLGNAELMNKISGIISSSKSENKEDALPEVIEAISKEVNVNGSKKDTEKAENASTNEEKSRDVSVLTSHSGRDSAALLKAMKPFLSKERCDMVDNILKFEQLAEIVKLTR